MMSGGGGGPQSRGLAQNEGEPNPLINDDAREWARSRAAFYKHLAAYPNDPPDFQPNELQRRDWKFLGEVLSHLNVLIGDEVLISESQRGLVEKSIRAMSGNDKDAEDGGALEAAISIATYVNSLH